MSAARLFLVLRARWITALAVFTLVVLLALGVSIASPRQYTASASVVVDAKSSDSLAGIGQGVAINNYMTTQIDVITSERVVLRAVRAMKLHENPTLIALWTRETQGAGDFTTWMAESIQRRLEARPSRDSNVIAIAYPAQDPKVAAATVNAIVRAYIDTSLELRIEPARQYNAFFDERSRKLREELEAAQRRLSEYERSKGLLATDERVDVENARLAQLSAQVVELQTLAADSESRRGRVVGNRERMQEVLSNPVISGMKSELGRQRSEITQLRQTLGESHPRVAQIRDSIEELKGRIDEEAAKVTGGIGVANDISQNKLSIMKHALEDQRERVMRLKTQRDEAAVLLRDVQNAQRAYDAILARLQQSSLESQNTQTNVSVLKEARPPVFPSSPKFGLNLALGAVAGFILGLAAALAREAIDPMIRSEDDILALASLPIVVDLGIAARPSIRLLQRKTRGLPRLPGLTGSSS
jgi:polysaccharide biosynthesis transport protein